MNSRSKSHPITCGGGADTLPCRSVNIHNSPLPAFRHCATSRGPSPRICEGMTYVLCSLFVSFGVFLGAPKQTINSCKLDPHIQTHLQYDMWLHANSFFVQAFGTCTAGNPIPHTCTQIANPQPTYMYTNPHTCANAYQQETWQETCHLKASCTGGTHNISPPVQEAFQLA